MNINWRKRFASKAFWVSLFAFIALTGQVFGFYQVPQGWDSWVNVVLALLTAMGVIIDPTTSGIGDKDE